MFPDKTSSIFKYGIGIFTDVSEIEFEKRMFELNSVSIICHSDSSSPALILKKGIPPLAATLGRDDITGNIFFSKTAETDEHFSLIIPKDYYSKEPITLQIKANHKNALCNINITIEENADVVLIEKIDTQEYLGFNLNLHLKQNARVKYIILQNTKENAYTMAQRIANIEKDAVLEWIDIELGGKITKSDIHTNLIGEGAQSSVNSLFFVCDKQTIDMYTATRHVAPYTRSDMQTKGLLNGQGKAISRGLIHIDHDALKSEAFERIDTLLLSNDAQVNAVPELEIENSDVKCSHAVTTTRVNEEKMFYMQSRGIVEAEAVKLATLAHVDLVLCKIEDEELRLKIKNKIEEKLSVIPE